MRLIAYRDPPPRRKPRPFGRRFRKIVERGNPDQSVLGADRLLALYPCLGVGQEYVGSSKVDPNAHASSAATPGRVLPSSHSRKAPPALET